MLLGVKTMCFNDASDTESRDDRTRTTTISMGYNKRPEWLGMRDGNDDGDGAEMRRVSQRRYQGQGGGYTD